MRKGPPGSPQTLRAFSSPGSAGGAAGCGAESEGGGSDGAGLEEGVRPNRPSMLGVPDRRPDRSPGVEGASGKMPPAHQTLGGRGPFSRGSRWGAWRGSRPRPAERATASPGGPGGAPLTHPVLDLGRQPVRGPLVELRGAHGWRSGGTRRDGPGRAWAPAGDARGWAPRPRR